MLNMSAPSYRLEAPRPRPPPLPLRTNNLPIRNSQILGQQKDATETLLYDLPSSKPTSPTRVTSPTSPTSPYSPGPRSGRRAGLAEGAPAESWLWFLEDPEIPSLDALEREEEKLEAEGFYDMESEMVWSLTLL